MAERTDRRRSLLPERAQELLAGADCEKYMGFADGQVFLCPSVNSPDGRILVLALSEEHTDLGRALVDALWFSRPVRIVLRAKAETLGFWAEVYRCHIAGPLFRDKLLEVRKKDPGEDMASAWELHFLKKEAPLDVSAAKRAEHAARPEWHIDNPALHKTTEAEKK